MKKIYIGILFIISLIILSGCATTETGIIIKEDNVYVKYKVLVNKTSLEENIPNKEEMVNLKDELKKQYQKENMSIKIIENEEYSGFTITEELNDLTSIKNSEIFINDFSSNNEKGFIFNSHIVEINIPETEKAGRYSTFVEQSMLKDSEDTFFIKTKNKVINHNADKVEGNKHIWNVEKDTNIMIEYQTLNKGNVILLSIGLGLFLIGLVTFIIFKRRIRKV